MRRETVFSIILACAVGDVSGQDGPLLVNHLRITEGLRVAFDDGRRQERPGQRKMASFPSMFAEYFPV